jgi:hypothetical protein
MALQTNLYGHNVFEPITRNAIQFTGSNDEIMDLRSILAKRSVAENSFESIVGLKTPSPPGTATATAPYLKAVLAQLGVTVPEDVKLLLGDRPSYYAQLETLSQRVYQNPEFFTDLYDSPANVERKNVAMQAIGLMLDRDSFKSELRSESILSVWLETEIMKYQQSVQNRIAKATPDNKPVIGPDDNEGAGP